jgi:hypothetical protein
MALIQGMENANKTRVHFGWCANGGSLEGMHTGAWLDLGLMIAIGGAGQYSSNMERY